MTHFVPHFLSELKTADAVSCIDCNTDSGSCGNDEMSSPQPLQNPENSILMLQQNMR